MAEQTDLIARTLAVHAVALHILERADTLLARLAAAPRCGCGSLKQHGWPQCDDCTPHLGLCGPCGASGIVVDGLCVDCAAREARFSPEHLDVGGD
jgi:hypothetical protein